MKNVATPDHFLHLGTKKSSKLQGETRRSLSALDNVKSGRGRIYWTLQQMDVKTSPVVLCTLLSGQ